jgi:hypothetical protein
MPRPAAHPGPRPLRRVALALLAAGIAAGPAWAHSQGMYRTRQEAERRAAELKCKGVFAMGALWMPCANEQALHQALQNE